MKKYIAMLISFFQTIAFNSRFNRQKPIAPANLRLMIFLCGLFFLLAPQISISAQNGTFTTRTDIKSNATQFSVNSPFTDLLKTTYSPLLQPFSPQSCIPAPSGLITWYRAENNTNDSSGNANNATPEGTIYAAGKVGQGFNFNGGSSRVFIPQTATPLYGSAPRTIELWAKVINPNPNGELLYYGDLNQNGVAIDVNGMGSGVILEFFYIHGQYFHVDSGVPLNQWMHIALTYDGGTVRYYVNGTLRSTQSIGLNTQSLNGRLGGLTGNHDGSLDEIKFYNRALTATEVQNIYNSGSDGLCTIPLFSIGDTTVSEPASGNLTATFLVSLEAASNQTTTVDYATANGTATAGQDYTATSGTLTFAPGEATKAINVIANSDALTEAAETFTVNLSNAVNAPISDAQGIGTIRQTLSGNGKIAFNSRRDGNLEIYSMNSDGSGQTRLTNNAANDELPMWSPDGTKISFASSRDGTPQIYTMNADGTNQTRLSNNGAFDYYPAWSPNGSKIVFNSTRDGNSEIYTMNPDGSGQTNLTNIAGHDEEAKFSPDGSKIVFTSRRDAGNYEIYTMNADGSNQTRLTNTSAAEEFPSWSPDGSKIAFYTNRDGNDEIYLMNPDGSAQTRLTNNSSADYFPTWSPDGTKITFTATRDGNYEVYTMNPDGSNQTRLTNVALDDYFSSWQPVAVNNGAVQFSAASFSIIEFPGTVAITVTRTGGSDGTVAVNYATSDSTATAGTDYSATSGTIVFNSGETSKTFTVPLIDDAIYEGTETLNLTLSSPTGGSTLGAQTTAVVNIFDGEGPPVISINNITVNEPLSGTTTANFTVTLTGATTVPATVNYTTFDNTAIAPGDYIATNGTLTFALGETSKNIAVIINSDNVTEAFESFRVNISGATNSQTPNQNGVGTIRQQYGTGGKILFSSNRDGDYELYMMNADGSNQTQLTFNADADVWARWSPDGSKIAFASDRDGNSEVYVMNADGSNVVRLTNNAANDSRPSWSPFGNEIVFTSNRDGDNEIYSIYTDGTPGTVQYTGNTADDDFASWSWSSSNGIAFHSDRDGNSEIYSFNLERLTNNATADYSPNYSPDGTKIAFEANRDGNSEVYTMNADGTAQTNLSNNASVDGYPSWSPESSKILFNSTRNGAREIYVMNPDGTTQTRLTNNSSDDFYPHWQPVSAAPADVQFSSATYTVAENVATATISVTRTNGNGTASIDYATSNGSATAGDDYAATSGTLTFNVGETSKTFTVSITDDALVEGDETINLALSNPVNILLGTPNTAVLTITDNEPPINLTINDVTVTEPFSGTIAATFTVNLSPSSASAVTVNYATDDNTATNPSDYAATSGTLNFTAGQTSKTVTVNVNADSLAESTETFFVNLSGANGAIITDAQGIGTIQNLSGTLRAWGDNFFGQLGIGNNVSQALPIALSNVGDIIQIGGRYHTLALKADGTVLSWGSNSSGQLGNGNTTNSNTPGAVNVLTDVIAVSAGLEHSLALKADGTVWGWGRNSAGATGLGTFAGNATTPTQISGLTGVTAIEAGYSHSIALKADGTVWTWGENSSLQLGTSGGNRNAPFQVPSLTNVLSIAAGSDESVALKTDGTVFVWGNNGFGQFGNNTVGSNSATPTQSTITNVTQIAAGEIYIVALKTDGTVWTWGSTGLGQIGNGTTNTVNSLPVQANITDITDIQAHSYTTLVRKKNGSIWTWGYNRYGQMGNGTITPNPFVVATPVQSSVGINNAVFGIGTSSGFVSNPIVTTPSGANVKTNLGDAALTFSNVTGAGNTTITAIDAATTGLNTSYTIKSDVQGYNLQTTATFTGNIEVCLKVPMVYSQPSFFALRLLHGEGSNLIDRTSTTNYAKREVCGIVTSLSPFVLGLAPTAASVSVSGRITAANGNGIRNVVVSLVDSNGQTRTAKTGSFGYYSFDEVEVGQTVTLTANSKRFTFINPTRIISVNENVSDADFTAIE